ncbi:MAG: twin-arginine translocation pathway signal protein [Rubrivivax sp.]
MQRRAFVRLVGGGAIGAATLPLAGCGAAVPPEAVAAWQGPGAEPDLRRWILGHAILAPHSHNLQSWLVDLRTPDEIVLRCDLDRLLPETDPFARQIMMSHGTFLELLDLAAREKGRRAEITLFPEGAFGPERIDDRPVARVRLQSDPAVARDPLFAQILRRHTNRNAYDPARAVPDAVWQSMVAAAARPGLRFGHSAAPGAPLARQREIAAEAWRIEMVTARAMLESFKVLRVGAAEIARHRDGLSLTDPFVVAMTKLGLFDRSRAPAPDSMTVRQQIDDFGKKIASTPAFLWLVSQGNARATQVEAGRAYARVQLAATAMGVVMQPLQQALQEYPEQARPYAAIHELLQAARPTETVQMWARVGFAEPVGPAPRRGVDAHLVKG